MGQSLSTSITIAVGHKVLLLSFLILLAGSLPSSSVGPHAVAATPDSPALSSGSESPSLSQDGFGGQEDDSTLEFPEEQEKGGLVGLGLMMDDEAPGGFEDSKQQDKGGKAHQSRASSPGKPTRGHAVRQSFRDMRKDVSAGKKQAKRKNSSSGSAEVGGEYKSLEQTESRLEFKLQNNLGSVDESGDGLVELSYEKRSEYHGKGTYVSELHQSTIAGSSLNIWFY